MTDITNMLFLNCQTVSGVCFIFSNILSFLNLCICQLFHHQMHYLSIQKMQQNLGVNSYPGRPDSFPAEEGRQYTPTKAEAQWQWDRDAQRMSPQLYSDGISPFSNLMLL